MSDDPLKPPCDCLQCRVRHLMVAWCDEAPENDFGQAIADVQSLLAFSLLLQCDPANAPAQAAELVACCVRSLNGSLEQLNFPFRIAVVPGVLMPSPSATPPTAH